MESTRQLKGFTLIELSLTLVIIGLLIGGILVGQDLIHQSKIKRTLSQIEQYNTAVSTFYSKYQCLPGDCNNAFEMGLDPYANSSVDNGNGNGRIEQYLEKENFWSHLRTAGLIAEAAFSNNTRRPASYLSGLIEIDDNAIASDGPVAVFPTEKRFLLCCDQPGTGNYSYTLTPSDAQSIDSKVDDGMPFNGNVVIFGNSDDGPSWSDGDPQLGATGGPYCAHQPASDYLYNRTQTSKECNLAFKVMFAK